MRQESPNPPPRLDEAQVSEARALKEKEAPLVFVKWRDILGSSRDGGWTDLDEIKDMKPGAIESVGWLAAETKDTITIVAHVSIDTEDGQGWLVIPKAVVDEVRMLKIGNAKKYELGP